MAMLTLNGLVQNVYTQPASTDRDTGEVRPESLRAQILCENIMESGEKKLEMVTLKVHTEAFKKLVGQKVRIPVGAFVAKGAIMFTRSVMKRNPSRLLEKKIPANDWTRSGVASFYCIEEQHNRHAKRITDTQKIRAHRANFPQVTSHSADGARMAGALAHGKPGAGGAKRSPPAGRLAQSAKRRPLVLMRNYRPRPKCHGQTGGTLRASVCGPRHPSRFQNCKMPAYSRPR